MRFLRPLIICALGLALTGCASIELVPADKAASVGDGISVMPQRPWNKVAKNPEMWTTQGPQIDEVRFFASVKSGHSLIELPGMKAEQVGAFDSKMLPNDVQDLVVTTLQREGDKNVKSDNLAPCPFGVSKGFCFDLSFASPADLEMKGMAMARKHDDQLDLILFQAPAEYYFGEMSPDLKKVFASVQAK